MTQIHKTIRLSAKTFLLSMGLTLVACGGGGGGGATPSAGLPYTGSTSAAIIDDTNTQAIAAGVMDGSSGASDSVAIVPLAGVVSTASNSTSSKKYLMLSMLVNQVKSTVESNPVNNTEIVSAISAPPMITSDCPSPNDTGSMSFTANGSSTNVSMSMNFNNYCTISGTESVTTNGSISAMIIGSGLDTNTPSILSMNITVPIITTTYVDSANNSITTSFAGTMNATFSENGDLASMSVSVNFAENGVVFKMEGFTYTATVTGIAIAGTIYHPTLGYVTFETDTNNRFVDYLGQLCGGTLIITGAAPSTVTITSDSTCSTYTYSGTDQNGLAFNGAY